MKDVWNAGTTNMRKELLACIYGECVVMFSGEENKDYDDLMPGVRNRLNRLHTVYQNRR